MRRLCVCSAHSLEQVRAASSRGWVMEGRAMPTPTRSRCRGGAGLASLVTCPHHQAVSFFRSATCVHSCNDIAGRRERTTRGGEPAHDPRGGEQDIVIDNNKTTGTQANDSRYTPSRHPRPSLSSARSRLSWRSRRRRIHHLDILVLLPRGYGAPSLPRQQVQACLSPLLARLSTRQCREAGAPAKAAWRASARRRARRVRARLLAVPREFVGLSGKGRVSAARV